MTEMDADYPAYDFKTHKGYITDVHSAALDRHGPCPQHRRRFVNVRRAAGLEPPRLLDDEDPSPVELVETSFRGKTS
jgi:ribonuclease HII